MLRELFLYLSTPCLPEFKTLGYLHELIAIQSRYKRVAKHWSSHTENCKEVLIDAAKKCHRHKKAVILGSGLLLDIPLDYLARNFDVIVLVDLIHLRSVKKNVKRYTNIELISHDVTGLASILNKLDVDEGRPLLPVPCFSLPEEAEHADLLVSLNL